MANWPPFWILVFDLYSQQCSSSNNEENRSNVVTLAAIKRKLLDNLKSKMVACRHIKFLNLRYVAWGVVHHTLKKQMMSSDSSCNGMDISPLCI